MGKAQCLGGLLVLGKFVRVNELCHRQVFFGRLEVLAKREDVAIRVTQIAYCLVKLLFRLTQAQHET